jgi:Divergent InlB B-repeat domain
MHCHIWHLLNTYTLTLSKTGTGSGGVTSSPAGIDCGSDCSQSYSYGTSVTLVPSPSVITSLWTNSFAGWSGDPDCSDGVVTMLGPRACIATFHLYYKLVVSLTGTGSGVVTSNPIGIDCGADCSQSYPFGTSITLTAVAAAGSAFSGWSGSADCADGVVTLTAGLTCTATFASTATARVIWIQPQSSAGFGPPGSLIIAGSASGAAPGTGVYVSWQDVTTGSPWYMEAYAPAPDSNGIWMNTIANANYFHQYQVRVSYGGITQATCTYQGAGTITWCP